MKISNKGLDRIESADPKNPNRTDARLCLQEELDLNNEFTAQYSQALPACAAAAR